MAFEFTLGRENSQGVKLNYIVYNTKFSGSVFAVFSNQSDQLTNPAENVAKSYILSGMPWPLHTNQASIFDIRHILRQGSI